MPLPALAVAPDSDGYSVDHTNPVIDTALDGGPSRFRLGQIGAPAIATVQWTLARQAYDYLMAFFRTTIKMGSLPFTVYLIVDGHAPASYTVHIVPGTFKLAGQSGLSYIVTAQLEVVVAAVDATADAATVTAGPGTGA
jgi:hypothetical protein